ncbi:MAG: SDR family NAD(P)-dependent oxidoreductase [Kofleriaceae bacterium]|nr:SDR family NAD(P)-dependent oxidoreductase [Kofleriaceae bacterium]
MATATNRTFAVVTGASTGIGYELAKQCIEHDFDILICAEDPGIHEAARHLGATGAAVEAVRCDLATYEGCEKLVRTVDEAARPVDALILNAGVGVGGPFVQTDLDDEIRMISVNAISIVHLSKRILPRMVNRGSGRVLITASIAATSPAPYLSVYGATKAFDLSFAEALRFELEDTGVTVTALQPGATDTEFFERAHMESTKVAEGKKDDPADVARVGFEAMMAGKDKVIAASLKSKLEGLAGELLPEKIKAKMQAGQTKPGTGHKHEEDIRDTLSKKHH